MPAKAGIQ